MPEVLTPIDASLIVPLRDTVELVRRTEAFLQLPEAQRHQRGQQYRDAVLKLYSLTSSANLLRQLYVQMKREALARATSADIQESHHR